MARLHKIFTVEVLTPMAAPYRQEAQSVVFPAPDGQVGVLAGRAPLVSVLGAGKLEVQDTGGRRQLFYVSGGFAQVHEGGVTILTEEFTPAEQLDLEQLWQELEQARSLPVDSNETQVERDEAVALARKRINLAQEIRRQAKTA